MIGKSTDLFVTHIDKDLDKKIWSHFCRRNQCENAEYISAEIAAFFFFQRQLGRTIKKAKKDPSDVWFIAWANFLSAYKKSYNEMCLMHYKDEYFVSLHVHVCVVCVKTPQMPKSPALQETGLWVWIKLSWCAAAKETPNLRTSPGHGTVISLLLIHAYINTYSLTLSVCWQLHAKFTPLWWCLHC